MRFQCPFCRGIVAVDNSDLGIDVQCGHCGEIVTVPYSRVATGAVIADFIILEELGRGGMGVVYLTHQISLDRPAALKVLADAYANNAEFVVNFIKEARAAAKLNHPHIVQAYAVGEDEGVFYFAMENIDGETMKQVLKREKVIPVEKVMTIIQQIAEALDYAWKEQKLIHRDIKPDNIMLTKNNRAKLADLGLSRVAGDIDDSEEDEVMGTPQYISPEHLTGAPMDVRSDIYSLGATFYHLLTGRFPFEGRTATEIARKHLEEKLTPPQYQNPEIPEEVGQIIVKMMAKNIKARYQDAQELVDDLRLARRGKSPKTATEGINRVKAKKSFKGKSGRSTGQFIATHTGNMSKTGTLSGTGTGTTTVTGPLSMTGTLSLEKPSSQKPLIFLLVIIFLLGGGVFAWWQYVYLPQQQKNAQSKPTPKVADTPKTEPGKQEKSKERSFAKEADAILDFWDKNSEKSAEFLAMCDKFFKSGIKPGNETEKTTLNKLHAECLKADETELDKTRQSLRSEHLAIIKRRKEIYNKKRAEEARLAGIKKRQEERKAELTRQKEEREKELEGRLQAYKDTIEKAKNSMRRRFIDYFNRNDFKSASNVFEPALKEPEKVSGNPKTEQEIAEKFAEWGKKMQECIGYSKKINKLINNSGSALAGSQLEIKRGVLGRIKKIENGKVTVKLLLKNQTLTVPVRSLAPKFFIKLLKKAAEKAGEPKAYYYYMISSGLFYRLKSNAPTEDWKREASATAYEYFKLKLKRGTNAEKAKLKKEYGKLSEFKRAKSDQ